MPRPHRSLIPTIAVAPARPWQPGEAPTSPSGLEVSAFARGLAHPRWLLTLPNGDILVAETNAPDRPKDATGVRGWFFRHFQKRGGGTAPSANRIRLLRDSDGDGVADVSTIFARDLNTPFGMVLVGDRLFIANTDAIVSLPYHTGDTISGAAPQPLLALPAGARNHHWTKSLLASPDGRKLYVGIGSNSNAAEHGLAEEAERARIWEVDIATARQRTFASGLRNPVGLTWRDSTLWVVVNERDELGNDLVPDYLTSVHDGAFYGWPYGYFGAHVDERVKPLHADSVEKALRPDYALGAHTASLGLVDSHGNQLGAPFQDGVFIGQHGSWNRKPPSGYRVIFVPFANGRPSGMPLDVLSGFLSSKGEARGRPVGVAIDAKGALLVADDVGNTIWRLTRRP